METNDVIIESTRRSSTTRATAQSKCFVHRSIIHRQENKKRERERKRERGMVARRSWWYRGEKREKRREEEGERESEQKVEETDRCQLNKPSNHLISQRQTTDCWSSAGNVWLLLLLRKITAYAHDRSPSLSRARCVRLECTTIRFTVVLAQSKLTLCSSSSSSIKIMSSQYKHSIRLYSISREKYDRLSVVQ